MAELSSPFLYHCFRHCEDGPSERRQGTGSNHISISMNVDEYTQRGSEVQNIWLYCSADHQRLGLRLGRREIIMCNEGMSTYRSLQPVHREKKKKTKRTVTCDRVTKLK